MVFAGTKTKVRGRARLAIEVVERSIITRNLKVFVYGCRLDFFIVFRAPDSRVLERQDIIVFHQVLVAVWQVQWQGRREWIMGLGVT